MIQPELLKCAVCCADYNNTTCVPKILSCGHTICSQCVDQILIIRPPKCPLDQKTISAKPSSKEYLTNLALVQLLDERSSVKYGLCLTHQEPKNLFCVTDKAKVCQRCVDEKENLKHQGHEIKTVSELQDQAQVKSEQLKAVMRKTDIEQQKIYELIEERKKEALGLKKRKFDQIRQFIDRKEEEAWSEIEVVFLQKQTKTEERFRKDMELKEQLQIQVNVLKSADMDENFFKMLNKEVDAKCSIKDEKQEIDNFTKKLVNRFKAKDESLQKSLAEAFKKFHPKLDLDEATEKEAVAEQKEAEDNYFQLSKISDYLGLKRHGATLRVTFPETWPEGSLEPLDFNEIKEVVLNLRSEKVTKETVSAVCYLWRNVEDVKHLTINLRNHSANKGDEHTLFFSHDFWASEKIETFKFNLRDDDEISRGGLTDNVITNKLFGPMKKMVNLKVFHFSLGATQVTNESVSKFAEEVLVKFTHLEELVLDLGWTEVSDTSIKKICSKVGESLKKLRTFHLDFSGSGASEGTFTALTGSVFPNLEKLDNFALNMDHTEVEDREVEKFFLDSRHYMKNIKSYKLSVNCCGITDKPVKLFAKYVLPSMTNLEHFSLILSDSAVTDLGVEKLFQKFNAPNIKSFEFDGGDTQGITNQSFVLSTQELLPKMPNLENLALVLDAAKIGNEGVNVFWTALEPIAKNLKHLRIKFRITEVSDEGFDMFINKILPAMESLTSLYIGLNDLLSGEYYNKLFTQLKEKAHNLEEFRLNLDGDQMITEENIGFFAREILSKMKKLKKLKLGLNNTEITVENVEDICVALKELPNIEYCYVKYYGLEVDGKNLEILRGINPNLCIQENFLRYE